MVLKMVMHEDDSRDDGADGNGDDCDDGYTFCGEPAFGS